jgi:predicted nucleic acid-binding protein
VTIYYADSSAVVATYLQDQEDHDVLRQTLRGGTAPVIVSDLARVEVAAAAMAAERDRRISDGRAVIDRFDSDCLPGGSLILIALDLPALVPRARSLVGEHVIGALDALHLATAIVQVHRIASGEEIVFVTRDRRQAVAARAAGFVVA